MVVLGYYDGEKILLKDPPPDLPINTVVEVTIKPVPEQSRELPGEPPSNGEGVLDEIASLAAPGGLPADFSEQHSHYTKGAPRR